MAQGSLVNDLIRIVSTYATTKATFDLLTTTSGSATLVYRPDVWRSKAIYESRGLIVDERIITGRWYEYYLMRNRTFYGNLSQIVNDNTTVVDFPVIYAIIGIDYSMVQRPDFSIGVWRTDSAPSIRGPRSVFSGATKVESSNDPPRIVTWIPHSSRILNHDLVTLIDERGAVIELVDGRLVLKKHTETISSDIVDVARVDTNGPQIFLHRDQFVSSPDLSLLRRRRDSGLPNFVQLCKVSPQAGVFESGHWATLRFENRTVQIKKSSKRWISPHIKPNLTTDLRIELPAEISRVVLVFAGYYLLWVVTPQRTLYVAGDREFSVAPIPELANRIQTVLSYYDTLFAITDD